MYQSARCAEFEPHFYVYDIVNRCITRRFLPLSADFSLLWNEETLEIDKYKKEKVDSEQSSGSQESKENQDISSFEVSPRGTFLVAVMPDSEMFSLKYLPEGGIFEFKDSIEPFYYTEIDDKSLMASKESTTV